MVEKLLIAIFAVCVWSLSFTSGHAATKKDLKLSLIGSSCVGKTNIIRQLEGQTFEPNMPATIGIEFTFLHRTIVAADGTKTPIRMWFWDMPGVNRLKEVAFYHLRNSHGVMLVYDINRRETFERAKDWFDAIRTSYPSLLSVLVLIGNGTDQAERDRQVSEEEGRAYAHKNGMAFFETSARKNQGLQEALGALLKRAVPLTLPQISGNFTISEQQ